MESWSTLITTNIAIWPRNVGRRKRKKWEDALNVIRKHTLPRIAKKDNQWRSRRSKRKQIMKRRAWNRIWRRSQVGTVWEISPVKSHNKYIIPNWQSSIERELNVWVNVKTKNGKNLKIKTLVDSGCTHTEIDEQLVKEKQIQTKLINFSFKIFNIDEIKNREVTKVVLLEIEINRHKKQLEAVVMDLRRTDMFLGHNWLVKYNSEVNWKNKTIKFMRCSESCKMKHQDIEFKTRRTQAMGSKE